MPLGLLIYRILIEYWVPLALLIILGIVDPENENGHIYSLTCGSKLYIYLFSGAQKDEERW